MISGVNSPSLAQYVLPNQPAQSQAPAKPAASEVQDTVHLSSAATKAIGDVDHDGDSK
jgi:hypothetical protein